MLHVVLIAVTMLALAFGAVHSVLMCVSPRLHAAFVRWFTRGAMLSEVGSGAQTRIAGLISVAVVVFLAWKLAGKILSPAETLEVSEGSNPVMKRCTNWTGILFGVSMILVGAYSNLRTSTVASWLASQGAHPADRGAFLQQIKIVGVVFILLGGFSIVVAIMNPIMNH